MKALARIDPRGDPDAGAVTPESSLRWTPHAWELADAFWPDALTLVLQGQGRIFPAGVRSESTGGVGVRLSPQLPPSGPSTVVDCTGPMPVVLRERSMPAGRLRCAIAEIHERSEV